MTENGKSDRLATQIWEIHSCAHAALSVIGNVFNPLDVRDYSARQKELERSLIEIEVEMQSLFVRAGTEGIDWAVFRHPRILTLGRFSRSSAHELIFDMADGIFKRSRFVGCNVDDLRHIEAGQPPDQEFRNDRWLRFNSLNLTIELEAEIATALDRLATWYPAEQSITRDTVAREPLTTAAREAMIIQALMADQSQSIRAIAAKVGCSISTVCKSPAWKASRTSRVNRPKIVTMEASALEAADERSNRVRSNAKTHPVQRD